jgi:hypothetical protein
MIATPFLIDTLSGTYPPRQRVLPVVREDRRIGAEEAEDFFQLVWVSMAHLSRTIPGDLTMWGGHQFTLLTFF